MYSAVVSVPKLYSTGTALVRGGPSCNAVTPVQPCTALDRGRYSVPGGISMNEDPPPTSLNGPPSQSANVVPSAPHPSCYSVPGGIPMNKDPPRASIPNGPPSRSANIVPSTPHPSHHSVPSGIPLDEESFPPTASSSNGTPSQSANIPSTHPSLCTKWYPHG
ncbi:hypothetical protein OG21DRAFT_1557683 [Imleria badia]|nr:hypothetical protein OG21DRAFT_1557683 [Imleria badia]